MSKGHSGMERRHSCPHNQKRLIGTRENTTLWFCMELAQYRKRNGLLRICWGWGRNGTRNRPAKLSATWWLLVRQLGLPPSRGTGNSGFVMTYSCRRMHFELNIGMTPQFWVQCISTEPGGPRTTCLRASHLPSTGKGGELLGSLLSLPNSRQCHFWISCRCQQVACKYE